MLGQDFLSMFTASEINCLRSRKVKVVESDNFRIWISSNYQLYKVILLHRLPLVD